MGAIFLTSHNFCFKGWKEGEFTLDVAGFPWLRRWAEAVKAIRTVAGGICHRLVLAAVSSSTVDYFLCQLYCVFFSGCLKLSLFRFTI
jgi:hypothetical protein